MENMDSNLANNISGCMESVYNAVLHLNSQSRELYKLHNFLVGYTPEKANQFCMAGFILKNTLSENGAVTRGISSFSDTL